MTNCDSSPLAVQNTYFYFNAVHPTGAAMALITKVQVANQMSHAIDRGRARQHRLEHCHQFRDLDARSARRLSQRVAPVVTGAAMATTVADSSPTPALQRPAPDYRWSTYAEINHGQGSGSLSRNFFPQAIISRHRPHRRARLSADTQALGAVFDYAMPNVTLNVQDAHNHVQSYSLASMPLTPRPIGLLTGSSLMVARISISTAKA